MSAPNAACAALLARRTERSAASTISGSGKPLDDRLIRPAQPLHHGRALGQAARQPLDLAPDPLEAGQGRGFRDRLILVQPAHRLRQHGQVARPQQRQCDGHQQGQADSDRGAERRSRCRSPPGRSAPAPGRRRSPAPSAWFHRPAWLSRPALLRYPARGSPPRFPWATCCAEPVGPSGLRRHRTPLGHSTTRKVCSRITRSNRIEKFFT